ncbi:MULTISPECIES: InlB B-repeat-containing protein [unclassified Janthinobacterium]|uniref:InlB B-repeat-containing protein n=1 Tax=unclassified Janthinobacterium TaxID=2610881 RepID=UPI0003461793|nr:MULTISPECIES: choice-of-anchor Q domain-containing protein [unclassified Janthinobacterium]MEC5161203.1 hypothetical protein [Janthinobacterium sp. CG_S6]
MIKTEPLMNSHTHKQPRTPANASLRTPYLRAPWARRTALTLFSALLITGCGGGGGGGDGNGGGDVLASETVVSPASPADTAAWLGFWSRRTLTVTSGAGGKVTSQPAGISCGSTCGATFPNRTGLTLTAQPISGYTFSQWGGACAGRASTCSVTLGNNLTVSASFAAIAAPPPPPPASPPPPPAPQPVAGAPVVSYTDAVSGPTSGGEGNNGAYLSIFGSRFGSSGMGTSTKVYIGGAEVANYRYLGSAKVGAKLGLQQITVQVGSLGGAAQGVALPVSVVVNGVKSNVGSTFTPNPGRVLFVAQNGNDATALAGDIGKPWRYLQTSARGGAYASLRAGDHVVIRGGNWSDTGFDGAWLRFRDTAQQGSAPTGAAGTGWIHITAYPGPVNGNGVEDVHYSTPAGVKGGIHGPNSAYFGTTGDWVSISNLRMDVHAQATSDAAPINLQYGAGPWRVVNNVLGPWPSTIAAPNNAKGAGVSGHGNNVKVFGNHIFGMACVGALENHGIYLDSGASNWEIGYNWVENITGGNLIQFFDNVGLAGNNYSGFPSDWRGFTGMKVHHNWLDGSGKYGLNLATSIVSGAFWNNVVTRSMYAGLRVDTISKDMDLTIAHNTFYDNDRQDSGSGNAQVLNTWGNYNPTGAVRIYDNLFAAGPSTVRSSTFYKNVGDDDNYLDFKRNLYWDNGYGWSALARDTLGLYGNPLFTAASSGKLTLGAGSPAIDKGTQAAPFAIGDDLSAVVARPQGVANDIGAYETVK